MNQPATRTLPERLSNAISAAMAGNRRASDGRAVRCDGWTAGRIRLFLEVLAHSGCVARAARAAGVSARSAYKFRRRAQGRGFERAWDLALDLARPCAPVGLDAAYERVEIVRRKGQPWLERRWFDTGAALAALARLDRAGVAAPDRPSALADLDFETLVARACGEPDPVPYGEVSRESGQERELGREEHEGDDDAASPCCPSSLLRPCPPA